jgi:hypothetical protein
MWQKTMMSWSARSAHYACGHITAGGAPDSDQALTSDTCGVCPVAISRCAHPCGGAGGADTGHRNRTAIRGAKAQDQDADRAAIRRYGRHATPFRILRRDNRRINSKAEQKAVNPLHWKREHQIALLAAAVVGAAIGIFAGTRQVEPSADHYWIWLGIWGAAGTVMGVTGGFIRQLSRSRTSN